MRRCLLSWVYLSAPAPKGIRRFQRWGLIILIQRWGDFKGPPKAFSACSIFGPSSGQPGICIASALLRLIQQKKGRARSRLRSSWNYLGGRAPRPQRGLAQGVLPALAASWGAPQRYSFIFCGGFISDPPPPGFTEPLRQEVLQTWPRGLSFMGSV